MTDPLYKGITEVGRDERDLTEGYGSQVEIEDLMETIHSYDVTADPANDRFILQDDQHQYSLKIQRIEPDTGYAIAFAEDEGFVKEGLEDIDVLENEEFALNPRDEATFDDGSNALYQASERLEMSENDELREKVGQSL